MKHIAIVPVAFIFALLCFIFIIIHAGAPILYSPTYDAHLKDHVNPFALSMAKGERTERIISIAGDMINAHYPIVLNIQSEDFLAASQYLEDYHEFLKNLDNVIVQLDLSDSELANFRRAGEKDAYILSELLNGTMRWKDLKVLEVQFRERGETETITSIRYEGETLKRKLQDLYREYLENDEIITFTGTKFGINTSDYESSVSSFREIVNSITNEHNAIMENSSNFNSLTRLQNKEKYFLFFEVSPFNSYYGDTITMKGQLRDTSKKSKGSITLFIDSSRKITQITDSNGFFLYNYRVEKDRPGSHTVFAAYDNTTFSEIEIFNINTAPSELYLEPPRVSGNKVFCEGSLISRSIPVSGAPVDILVDGKRITNTITKNNGSFSLGFRISPGPHHIKAEFHGEEFPLLWSESQTYDIIVPITPPIGGDGTTENIDFVSIIIYIIFISPFLAGAIWYIRYRKSIVQKKWLENYNFTELSQKSTDNSFFMNDDIITPSSANDDNNLTVSSQNPETCEDGNIEDISWRFLFNKIRIAISRLFHLRHYLSLTPREICALCRNTHIEHFVCLFTKKYEKMMYAGENLLPEEKECMEQAYKEIMTYQEGKNH